MPSTLCFAIAYDATPADPRRGEPRDAVSKSGVRDSVDGIEEALRGLGHRPIRLPIGRDVGATIAALKKIHPDAVVNLCEGLADDAAHEAHVAALFELARVPYTGAPPETLAIALRKPLAKALLTARGIPVPAGVEISDPADAPKSVERAGIAPPWFVKPSREDASLGIDAASVVSTARALRDRAGYIVDRYRQSALVEPYLDGREFNVTVIGDTRLEVLPIAEIDFSGMPTGHPRILTYEAKWSAGSRADRGSVPVCPARIDAALANRLATIAEAAVAAIGGRDVTRVDFRLDAKGQPFVLEVNANPDLSPRAGVARQVAARGWTYPEFVMSLCEAAMERGRVMKAVRPKRARREAAISLRAGGIPVPLTSTRVQKETTDHAVLDDSCRRPRPRHRSTGRAGGSSVPCGPAGAGGELFAGGTDGGPRGD